MQNSDDYLIQQFQNGDESAFTLLVNRHKRPIFQFILSKVKDRELASDLTQDVFVKLFHSADRFVSFGKFRSWLFRIAQNLCIDEFRKQKKATILSLDQQLEQGTEQPERDLEQTNIESFSPAQHVEYSELKDIIRLALDSLPEKQQTALILCQYHGMSYSEIAEIQKCPVGTVKSRIHAAMTKIREVLKSHDVL